MAMTQEASVEEQREQLTIEYLDLVQHQHNLKKQLENSIKNGTFELTLGRQEDNVDSITQFHIPIHLEISPLYKVHVSEKDEALQLVKQQQQPPPVDLTQQEPSTLLRQRRAPANKDGHNVKTREDSAVVEEESNESKEERLKKENPIYWFGVGVRGRVKASQVHFEQGLQIVTELANVQIKLSEIEKRISSLCSTSNTPAIL